MKGDQLTPEWLHWRGCRRRGLVRAGFSLRLAAEFSAREAQGRQRIAASVGKASAMAGQLRLRDSGDVGIAIAPEDMPLIIGFNLASPPDCTAVPQK